ncbi:uncharacterized protein LOC134713956 [Mytilus trossulus]|uniref:uncharacterized protein LOC134713956 n=1 Tax=Mytilus trossulus TaxID=6551 RepID=UPI0030069389
MSFQIAYCGSECFEIDEQKEHGENKETNNQIRLQNYTEDKKIGEGDKSIATEATSTWLNFVKLHFTNDEVVNKIKRRRNCAEFVQKQVANASKSCLLPIVSGLNITDSKTVETGTITLDERLIETEDAIVPPPVKMSAFLSSAANPWTADDNDENVLPEVEQVQPTEGCLCWPLVHWIYRIRYRLFDKKKDKKLQKKYKIYGL